MTDDCNITSPTRFIETSLEKYARRLGKNQACPCYACSTLLGPSTSGTLR